MIFPLRRFWTYTPAGFLAACLWNTCEKMHIMTPFAPQVFGLIIGKKGKRVG